MQRVASPAKFKKKSTPCYAYRLHGKFSSFSTFASFCFGRLSKCRRSTICYRREKTLEVITHIEHCTYDFEIFIIMQGDIPRQMSKFSEIPTHFVFGSCSNFLSGLPNYPDEQIQNLSFLLQIVLQLKLFS